jgi:hypothetical protein
MPTEKGNNGKFVSMKYGCLIFGTPYNHFYGMHIGFLLINNTYN